MLNLKSNNGELSHLIVINVTFAYGKLGCDAYGCDDKLVKKYVLDEMVLKSSKLSISFKQTKNFKDFSCIEAIEKELQDIIDRGFNGLHIPIRNNQFPRPKNNANIDNIYTPIFRSIRIFIDNEERTFIDKINDFLYVKINIVVRNDGQNIFIIAHGYKDIDEAQICWFNEKVDNNCELTIELR